MEHCLFPKNPFTLKLAYELLEIVKEIVIDTKDKMNGDLLRCRERSGIIKKRLGNPEQILDLAPLFLIKLELEILMHCTVFIKDRL
jgi:hypothetical protein